MSREPVAALDRVADPAAREGAVGPEEAAVAAAERGTSNLLAKAPSLRGRTEPRQTRSRGMKPFPHRYAVQAAAAFEGCVTLAAEGVPALSSAPPVEFDGPGDQWSPESLLVAAVADCFVLTFRAIARASRLEWTQLECRAEGTLDRVDGVTRFVGMRIEATLTVAAGTDPEAARRLLSKAERSCLITRSLNATAELEARIVQA